MAATQKPQIQDDATYNLCLPVTWHRIDYDHRRGVAFNVVSGEFLFYGRCRTDYGPTRGGVIQNFRRLKEPNEPVGDYDSPDGSGGWRRCGYTGAFREGLDHVMIQAKGRDIKRAMSTYGTDGRPVVEACHLGFCTTGLFAKPKHKDVVFPWN